MAELGILGHVEACAQLKRELRATFDKTGSGLMPLSSFATFLQALGFNGDDIPALVEDFKDKLGRVYYCSLLDFIFTGVQSEQLHAEGDCDQRATSADYAWLCDLVGILPGDLRAVLVAYRGFHCPEDRGACRPLENTLPAYEQAWGAGIRICECDVFLTSDAKLCLNHDASLRRLAMLSNQRAPDDRPVSRMTKNVTEISFKELLATPLKTGVRAPLLQEVLSVASHLEDARLIVDLKPSHGGLLARALVQFCLDHPELVKLIAAVTSFDANELSHFIRLFPSGKPRPLVLLLAVQGSAADCPGRVVLDLHQPDVCKVAEGILSHGDARLDGVYCQWSEGMVAEAASNLEQLCRKFPVGVWKCSGEPDDVGSAVSLARLGVRFVNTDFPQGFLREHVREARPAEASGLVGSARRRELLGRLSAGHEFDMLIIGGGATGLGTALEAARLGYSVALVERGDFACGTSSKSTNMIHGGVRYLQAFVRDPEGAKDQMGVVRRGLAEQSYMYNSAPFNVQPTPFMVACYSQSEREEYDKLLKAYDDLGHDDPFPEAHWCGKKETLFRFPQLRQEGLVGSWVYYDGQQDDARMALLIALTAFEAGAVVTNYTNVTSLIKDASGILRGVCCQDLDGGVPCGAPFEVRAKVVVNATGPFTDAIIKLDQGPTAEALIKPAAGTHIVIPDHFSPDRTALSILETSDGRVIFYLPWMGQTMVGTTDYISEVKPLLEAPEADIDWILREVNRYLNPGTKPAEKADVLAAWCGIRPLAYGTESATGTKETRAERPRGSVAEEILGGQPPSMAATKATKSVSREHVVLVSDSKLITISGGKWTSYRAMAEHTVAEAVRVGGLAAPKLAVSPSDSRDGPAPEMQLGLVGTRNGANVPYNRLELACAAPFHAEVVELRDVWGFERDIAANLVTSYGTRAKDVAAIGRGGAAEGLGDRISRGYPWIMAQVSYACRSEYAVSVPDVLSRRTRLAQVDVLAAYDAVPRVAEVMARELSWSSARVREEVRQANEFLKSCGLEHCRKHRLKL